MLVAIGDFFKLGFKLGLQAWMLYALLYLLFKAPVRKHHKPCC